MIKYVPFIFLRFFLYGLEASDINSFIGQEVGREGYGRGGGAKGVGGKVGVTYRVY